MNKVLKREKWVSRWLKEITSCLLEPTEEETKTIKNWLYDLYDNGARYLYPISWYKLPSDVSEVLDNHEFDNLRLDIRAMCKKYGKDKIEEILKRE